MNEDKEIAVDGSMRMTFCSACKGMASFYVYTSGAWKEVEKHVSLVKVNGVHVCDTDACKRKAKLKAFW